MYVCLYVCSFITREIVGRFQCGFFIELLKTTKVTWAKKKYQKYKIGHLMEEKHHFNDARTSERE